MGNNIATNVLNYGGNIVRKFDPQMIGVQYFSQTPYVYYYFKSKDNDDIIIDNFQSFSVYIYHCNRNAHIQILEINKTVQQGEVVQIEKQSINIKVRGGCAVFFIAGTKESYNSQKKLEIIASSDIKKVTKPWGYELWLNGEQPGYAFKKIYIKSGFRTSLQYHNYKRETNVLFNGSAKLFYKSNDNVSNDDIKNSDISYVDVSAPTIIDIMPKVLHRIESVGDITLCEASTPHLDDVIRVSDDKNRGNGRIQEEHNKK